MILYLIIGGAAVGQTLFCVLYTTLPWWRSNVGRALFLKAVTLAIFVDAVAVRVFFPDTITQQMALYLYGLVAAAIWYQLIALIRVRLKAKQDEVSTVS